MSQNCLIIEKNKTSLEEIRAFIESTAVFEGIFLATNKRQALAILTCREVDIICSSDLTQGRWIQGMGLQGKTLPDIPVVNFTRERDSANRIKALESGACDCLDLNICHREAAARLRRHLQNKHTIDNLRRLAEDMSRAATTDPLTGLKNRRHFDQTIETELARAARTGEPLTLMLLDIDRFKRINDTYGHQTGDVALKAVTSIIADCIRKYDSLCRFGGEEFALIMPRTGTASAMKTAERIRQAVANSANAGMDISAPITLSIGVSVYSAFEPRNSAALIEEADQALYQAKDRGRNRIELFEKEGFYPACAHIGFNTAVTETRLN